MFRLLGAAVLGMACVAGPARAMTVPDAPTPPGVGNSIVHVDGGCGGPQFYRAVNGACYVKPGFYAPPPPPPRVYYRACPYGFHLNPWGHCRPNY